MSEAVGSQPAHPRAHGTAVRGGRSVPQAPLDQGRFGRMFRRVPVASFDDAALAALAQAMAEAVGSENAASGDNARIPAGYTYLGQFIDHDVTFDPASSLQRANDPDALVNFRTPRFDLDSLYGGGPADEPFLYDQNDPHGCKLLVGAVPGSAEPDLPRNSQGRALLGDPRNDENTLVSQLHLAFVHLHNRLVDVLAERDGLTGSDLLTRVQQQTRWHYQWVVVHDYLKKILGDALHAQLLDAGDDGVPQFRLPNYRVKNNAYIPVEFSVAGFRFGHTQVRGRYRINQTVPELPIFSPNPNAGPLDAFHGNRPLPGRWTVRWPLLLDSGDGGPVQLSRRLDHRLAAGLFTLPGETGIMRSLALRNLQRGQALALPAGQDVARAVRAQPLTDEQLKPWTGGPAPLWFYLLREADALNDGQHLGPVGGRIVGETLLGLLRADPLSWVNVQPDWQPTLPTRAADPRSFDLFDLLAFARPDAATRA